MIRTSAARTTLPARQASIDGSTVGERSVRPGAPRAKPSVRSRLGDMLSALLGAARRRLGALLEPIPRERRQLNWARHAQLPEHLRGPEQILGIGHHACGATHSVLERCDFACTSCYLGKAANATPPLPEDEVFRQLDQLRAFLGPQGKAQITSGEVTLLPRQQLGRYVRYAKTIGLDPMVMSHGQRWLDDPGYLEDLVREDGLEKVAIHVDVTQRGRRGWHPNLDEKALHPLRERYAQLIRTTRARTERTLHAAHTVTITGRNVDAIPGIVRWVAANADAFRMLSLQPAAEVGRTQDARLEDVGLDDVWARICAGLGQSLNRHAMHFGHPECHIIAPLVILRWGARQKVLETARAGKRWDRAYLARLMRAIGGYSTRGRSRGENVLGLLGLCARHPLLVAESVLFGAYRLTTLAGWLAVSVPQLLRGRRLSIRPLAIIVHKFMSPDELDTELGRERLAACVFQVPVDGRMAPMCEMNATPLRTELNARMRADARRNTEA